MDLSARVLILEDDPLVVAALKLLLKHHRLEIHKCIPHFLQSRIDDVGARLANDFDLVLLDLCHDEDPDGSQTIRLFPVLQQRVPHAEVVVQSGLKDIAIMRKCLQLGAQKFVLKDHIADEIPVFVSHCLERRQLRRELDAQIVGESKVIDDLKRRLLDLRHQNNSVDVLIEGETGTGKELCAKALHRDGPFRAINVAAIPYDLFEAELFGNEKGAFTGAGNTRAGYLESVENGVLFLDELQSLPLSLQTKLLRVVETRAYCRIGSTVERRFEGRIVSAANETLYDCVKKNRFREDLYFRLAATLVSVPPLRAREKDIALLAKHFLRQFSGSGRLMLTDEALRFLCESYDWPGNVRELRGVIRTLAMESKMPYIDAPEVEAYIKKCEQSVQTESREVSDGGFFVQAHLGFDENVALFEKHVMAHALSNKNYLEAREALRLSRSRFYEKLKQHGFAKTNNTK